MIYNLQVKIDIRSKNIAYGMLYDICLSELCVSVTLALDQYLWQNSTQKTQPRKDIVIGETHQSNAWVKYFPLHQIAVWPKIENRAILICQEHSASDRLAI